LLLLVVCNERAICKLFKTRMPTRYKSSIGSQIREVRDGVRALVLKLYLLMFIDRIFDSKVDGGIPSKAAAPDGPDTRPRASARAESIILRSSVADLRKDWREGLQWSGCPDKQHFLTERLPFWWTTTERSITFCSSRMFPGHGH